MPSTYSQPARLVPMQASTQRPWPIADEWAIHSLSARSASACLQSGASFRTQTHRGDAAAAEQPLSLRTTLPLEDLSNKVRGSNHGKAWHSLWCTTLLWLLSSVVSCHASCGWQSTCPRVPPSASCHGGSLGLTIHCLTHPLISWNSYGSAKRCSAVNVVAS